MNNRKNVEVIGGYNVTEEIGEGANKRARSIFQEKRRVVVPEDKLAILFRRDYELCAMSSIRLIPTTRRPTILI